MSRTTFLQWLRITWTAFWGIAAILLIALWVRSYWTLEIINPRGHEVWIARGRLIIDETWLPSSAPPASSTTVQPTSNGVFISQVTVKTSDAAGTGLNVPIGVSTLAAALLSAVPWITHRFSLRSLLIA